MKIRDFKLISFFVKSKGLFYYALCGNKEVLNNDNRPTVVIQCGSVDRYMTRDAKKYSPILDRIYSDNGFSNYRILSFAKFGEFYCDSLVYGKTINVFSPFDYFLLGLLGFFGFQAYKEKRIVEIYKNSLIDFKCFMVIGIQPDQGLVQAGHRINVRIVDLLHGYGIRKNHSVYGDKAFSKKKLYLCTDYIAMDNFSRNLIMKNVAKYGLEVNVHAVRSPLLDMIESVPYISDSYKKIVLVTLQWGIERFEKKYPHEDGFLHPRIEEIIKETEDILYVVKPHPMMLQSKKNVDRLNAIAFLNDNILINTDSNIISLLKVADIHFTIWSSSIKEAAFCGVKSYLFSSDDHLFEGTGLYLEELRAGVAQRVHNLRKSEIIELLRYTPSKDDFEEYNKNALPPAHFISEVLFN